MKTIERQLYYYIDDQKDCEYTTSKGITISTIDIYWLKAEFKWVNTEDTSLAVYFYCPIIDFVKTLEIRNICDIDDLTPGRLMELYYEGLAETVCFITLEYIYCMTFKKLGNIIVAENERGLKHIIPAFRKLETPDEYILYATEYYKLMECNEN
jgi:hypothetical protein